MSAAALLSDRREDSDTRLIDECSAWPSYDDTDLLTIKKPESTGSPRYAIRLCQGVIEHPAPSWFVERANTRRPRLTTIVLRQHADEMMVLTSPTEQDLTFSPSAPMFGVPIGTGEMISDIRDSLRDAWRRVVMSTNVTDQSVTLADVPRVLGEVRSRAGLPVQDLAAMFGIGRRQFYNLLSGVQQTDDSRLTRIRRVVAAITDVNLWVGGNSRRARLLLLARFGGDSIYDAAVADDEARLASALSRARTAALDENPLPHRRPPSNRATFDEAISIREHLHSMRDQVMIHPDAR